MNQCEGKVKSGRQCARTISVVKIGAKWLCPHHGGSQLQSYFHHLVSRNNISSSTPDENPRNVGRAVVVGQQQEDQDPA